MSITFDVTVNFVSSRERLYHTAFIKIARLNFSVIDDKLFSLCVSSRNFGKCLGVILCEHSYITEYYLLLFTYVRY